MAKEIRDDTIHLQPYQALVDRTLAEFAAAVAHKVNDNNSEGLSLRIFIAMQTATLRAVAREVDGMMDAGGAERSEIWAAVLGAVIRANSAMLGGMILSAANADKDAAKATADAFLRKLMEQTLHAIDRAGTSADNGVVVFGRKPGPSGRA